MDSVDTFIFFIFHLHQESESQQFGSDEHGAESIVRVPTDRAQQTRVPIARRSKTKHPASQDFKLKQFTALSSI